MTITHEEISRRARTIWEQEGRPEGRDKEHWLQAEAELRLESPIGQAVERAPEKASRAPQNDGELAKGNGARKRSARRGR